MKYKYINNPDGQLAGHDYVDLGLPSGNLWANCNIGASSPYETGDFFAWGETQPKSQYIASNYKFGVNYEPSEMYTFSKYVFDKESGVVDNKILLDDEDDAVRCHWGEFWSMPTIEDMMELLDGCEWIPVGPFNESEVAGFIGVSKKNLQEIFFPVLGEKYDSGCYWSASLATDMVSNEACRLDFSDWSTSLSSESRYWGLPIRAVANMTPKARRGILMEVTEESTMERIMGPWKGEVPTWDRIGMRYYHLYHVPIKDFTASDIAFLIRQSAIIEYVMPVAIEILKVKPFIGVEFYEGDLLSNVLTSIDDIYNAADYWASHGAEKETVIKIFEENRERLKWYRLEKGLIPEFESFCGAGAFGK